MNVTVPLWMYVASAIVAGLSFHWLVVMPFLRWAVRDGPLSEEECPICLRPHDSEVYLYKRQLAKMHENYERLETEVDAAESPRTADEREKDGKIVRDSFVSASADLGIEHPKTPEWADLPEHAREMYRRIGDAVMEVDE